MSTGFAFPAGCGDCGGALIHDQPTVDTSTEQAALTHCTACGRQWLLTIRMIRVPNPDSERRARYRAAEKELVPA